MVWAWAARIMPALVLMAKLFYVRVIFREELSLKRHMLWLSLSLALAISACQTPLAATAPHAAKKSQGKTSMMGNAKKWRGTISAPLLTGYVRDGGLRADVRVNGALIRFDQRGEGWLPHQTGQGALRQTADGRYHYSGPDGANYIFAPVMVGTSAMLEPAMNGPSIGGRASYARITEARFTDGERWTWGYETQDIKTNCEVKGRFGLTNPDCRIQHYARPIHILSSRGLMVKAVYASGQAGPDYNRLAAITLYDVSRCSAGQDCAGARVLRTIAAHGSTAIPPL